MKMNLQNFAGNLRCTRLERGLTQRALGERIGFSEKTVSKWECGAAIPDIETLFSLAEVLSVTVEALFSDGERYYLGIDGGGTKTELALADASGKVIRTCRVGACNPVDIGLENAKRILRDAICEICRGIRLPAVSVFAGIAGGSTAGVREELASFFATFGFAHAQNDSDNRNIIAAGLGARDGMTVILGTGFCIYTQKDGVHHRISGWGYLLDDGGSGYNLGRDALHAYYAAYDGTGEKTLLTEEIDRIHPGGADRLLPFVYEDAKRAIGSFAPAVFAACERGDRIAQNILERNVSVAASLILRAADMLGGDRIPIVLAGGLTKEARMIDLLRAALQSDERICMEILQEEPVRGALMLAMKSEDCENE